MRLPTITDVLNARRVLANHLAPTPLRRHRALDANVLVKHENTQPTGAFKVRGGINLLAGMTPAERARGVLAYSTGNHAQGIAYAAARFDAPCTIVMPSNPNPNPAKAGAIRALGAELVEYGVNFDEARGHAERLARQRDLRLVSAANEPELIAGVATGYLEIFEQAPDLDTVVVPVGGGSGAAAACLVAAAVAPQCRIVAVQSAASPAAHDSWRAGHPVERPNGSTVEGLATGAGFDLTQRLMRAHLADFLLVDDAAILAAQWVMMRDMHTLAEGGGAAALAAVLGYPERFAGQRLAVMCSGGNASEDEIRRSITAKVTAKPAREAVPAG
ncbi:MAG: pyridoxal-phosphate dependent enzyme [Pseudonocardiaceae bacterium]|nr:pyridoxal-phosphate dependent enzyme [Pseudonocardiaceae bacterium]